MEWRDVSWRQGKLWVDELGNKIGTHAGGANVRKRELVAHLIVSSNQVGEKL